MARLHAIRRRELAYRGDGAWVVDVGAVAIGLRGGLAVFAGVDTLGEAGPEGTVPTNAAGGELLELAGAAEDAALAIVGTAAAPVPAAEAVPREGVALHVAERLAVKLWRPSACKGSGGPAGRVPT